MQDKYERGILRISVVFLIAAAILIPMPYLGMGASLPLVLLLAAAAWGLYEAWQRSGGQTRTYLSGLWLGPVIALLFTIYGLLIGASPGEVQALGGIAGIIGVVNLLLRPVYRLLHYVLAGAIQIGKEMQEEKEREERSG
jgi:hypothetical protein